jgi:5-methyltetrahydrofolate--homocysteine methyltransferase
MLHSRSVSALDWLPSRLLLDGAMGTSLIARGLDLDREAPELWNLRQPEHVRDVHRRFIEAGAGAIQTNTFGANRLRLGRYGLGDQVEPLCRAAVELARSAAPEGVLVFGSMGPTGALPPPEGDADLFELEDVFAEQASALSTAGVELLHLETFYHPKEMRAALRGCHAGAPGVPLVASVAVAAPRMLTSRDRSKTDPLGLRAGSSYTTVLGFPADSVIGVALEERADGVGVNCGLAPADLRPFVERLVARTRLPVFAQPIIAPSSGPPLYPGEFAAGVAALFAAGARVVGGCCGTSPTDLAAAHDALALE